MKRYLIALLSVLILAVACTSQYVAPTPAPAAPQAVPSQPANVQTPPAQTAPPQASPQPQTITYVKTTSTSLGQILVDDNGMTLYVKSGESGSSTCNGGCASVWPPLSASGTVSSRDSLTGTLGTITRTDSVNQATYNNMPLYRYSGDSSAGQTNGNGIGGVWSVVVISPPPKPMQQTSNGYRY